MKIHQKPITIGPYNSNEITIENSSGISISFLTLGGIITKFMAPDKDGKFENIVLSLNDPNDYYNNSSIMGAVVGRTSGRIYDAHVNLMGNDVYLSKNDGIHHIHGGVNSFSRKIYDFDIDIVQGRISVALTAKSKDGEEGYPGNAEITVIYSLDEDNNFKKEYMAEVDEPSLINVSSHTYFNLSGNNKTDALGHLLLIPSDTFYEIDEQKIITGRLLKTKDTPFDFNHLKEIGSVISLDNEQISKGNGLDHCFLLNNDPYPPTVTLYEPVSMRSMNITTNQRSLCLYTQNYPIESELAHNGNTSVRRGIDLQFQAPPIGRQQINLPYSMLLPGEEYYRYVNYFLKLI